MNDLPKRITVHELLQLSQNSCPSEVFNTGGILFDFWLCWSLPQRTIGHLLQELKAGTVTDEYKQSIIANHGMKFYIWIIKTVRDLKPSFNKQLYFVSVLLHWKGCSGAGLELFSATNLTLSQYLFQKIKREHFQQQHEQAVKLFSEDFPYVLWIDNYTKYFAKSFVSIKRDTSSLISTTAVALTTMEPRMLRYLEFPTVNITNSNEMLGADIFATILSQLQRTWNSWPLFHNSSTATVYRITTIPPSAKDAEDQFVENVLRLESTNGLKNFHGLEMLEEEVGSNKGLARVLDWVYQKATTKRHVLCTADQNIYWRYMKIVLNPRNSVPHLASRLVMVLGWWHPLKIAAQAVWKRFFGNLLAPAFLAVFPHRWVYQKPKLTTILVFWGYCHFAYSKFQRKLVETIEWCKQNNCNFLTDLCNLQDLFEFYIPTVLDYSISLREGDFDGIRYQQPRLLWLFSCLGSQPYLKALLLSMMQMHWMSLHAPGLYHLLRECTVNFNEEVGEVALSILARSVMGNSKRLNVEKLRENFVLIHEFRNITREFKDDAGFCSKRQLLRIDPEGAEVELLANHFSEVIDAMKNSSWKHFGMLSTRLNAASQRIVGSDDRALQLDQDNQLYQCYMRLLSNLEQANKSHEKYKDLFQVAT